MASPSTEEAVVPAPPLAGTLDVAAGLHARRVPLLDRPRSRPLPSIGDVGRLARRFSAMTFLSTSARRAASEGQSGFGLDSLPVRPPDYWSGYTDDALDGRPSTGDVALDRLVARRATHKRAAESRILPRRGLPSTVHRRSHSIAGPLTAPGGMARRLVPATVVPKPNPANSPQKAAARTPRSPRPRPTRRADGESSRPPRHAERAREVAVRPLLSGWRAPTAWRSIAAGPGVRLLPVGQSSLDPRRAGAGLDGAPFSWASTVERAWNDADSMPESVGQLLVGGPAVVVRNADAAGDTRPGRARRSPTVGHHQSDVTTSWSPLVVSGSGHSGAPTVVRRPPGYRPPDSRRPGRWLGRSAVAADATSMGARRVPMGPLGPVRWSARADEPVVARTSVVGSPWAATVAATSSTMNSGSSLTGVVVRPPISGGLTLVRGGRSDGSDLPVASVQRSGSHPAATRLRLVPPSSEVADTTVRRSGAAALTTVPSRSASASGARSAAPSPNTPSATYVGRAPSGDSFVSAPGAVAAHGLPAAFASLVGVTTSGPGVGRAATPGMLARLVHGEPVRRRASFDMAPPAMVTGAQPAVVTARSARHGALGLPTGPAALARGRATASSDAVVTAAASWPVARSRSAESGLRHGVAVAQSPGARFSSAVPTGPSVASLRRLPMAPAAFVMVTPGAPAQAHRSSAAGSTPEVVHRSRSPRGVSATVARRVRGHRPVPMVGDHWRGNDVPARSLPGMAPAALRPLSRVDRATAVHRRPLRPSAPGAPERFDEVLRSTEMPVRPVALPVRFRPLAERIIGRMPVQIATGVASRRALASVGASAATTNSIIHLPSAPDSSARTASILAHELTHVAAGSPVARFHRGRASAEETAATQVERIVARAARTAGQGRGPASPGTSGLPVAGFVGLRGSTAGPPVPSSAANGVTGVSGGSSSTIARSPSTTSAEEMVRRLEKGSTRPRSGRRSSDLADRAPVIGGHRAGRGVAESRPVQSEVESPTDPPNDNALLSEKMLDAIVEAIEARLLASIERRGGLGRGGF